MQLGLEVRKGFWLSWDAGLVIGREKQMFLSV